MHPHRISIWFFLFLLGVALWRQISRRKRVQVLLHRLLRRGAVVVQWYTLFFAGAFFFVMVSLGIFIKDCVFVPQWQIDENLQIIFNNFTELEQDGCPKHEKCPDRNFMDFKESLNIKLPIKVLSIFGQLSGLAVVLISMYHCWVLLVIPSHRASRKNELWKAYSWHLPRRVNWLMWIVVLPGVFCIELMLANISVWEIMIGTAPEYQVTHFLPAQGLETLFVQISLHTAIFTQFTAIYCFTRIISSLLMHTAIIKGHETETMQKLAREYKRLIRYGGFLGIWIYIAAGILRAVVVIGICLVTHVRLSRNYDIDDPDVKFLGDLLNAFVGLIGITFLFLTILSIFNMVIMTWTFIISDKLGKKSRGEYDANMKFVGVRLLLICSEVAPKAIEVFEKGTPLYEQTKSITKYTKWAYMSSQQADVMKITILNIACLVTALMNYYFWKDLDLERAGLIDFDYEERHLDTFGGADGGAGASPRASPRAAATPGGAREMELGLASHPAP